MFAFEDWQAEEPWRLEARCRELWDMSSRMRAGRPKDEAGTKAATA